jgi:predicted DNA-binding antitoxin AbrB/MazE fold protein
MLAYPTLQAVYRNGTLELLEPLRLPEGAEVKLILLESVYVPQGSVETQPRRQAVTVPAGAFHRLTGLVSVGGDALAESEALYDAESRD